MDILRPVDVVDIRKIQADFPILSYEIKPGMRVTYLDSTATTQKPLQVINAMDDYYRKSNANIHRGIHHLAEKATALYEDARARIAKFINAPSAKQVIFTRNTTESINLVAQTWGRKYLQAGDLIILTEMEHHSNLVPWQLLAAERNLRLEFIPVDGDGLLDQEEYHQLLQQEPKLVAFTHMSNVLGTITPAQTMTAEAHAAGAKVLIDAAQSVPHFAVDVQQLDADFLVFSGHKMCGPTGVGVLYGRKELLEEMPPFLGGGDMIKKVELRSFKANSIPHKFEAGTPAIAETIGLGAAVDYLEQVGMDNIAAQEQVVVNYALERLAEVPGVTVFGPEGKDRGGLTSFNLEGIHAHDVAQILDGDGIAVRAGHHCAMPLHDKLGIPASTRASYYLYNSVEDVDKMIASLYRVKEIFRI
ncbi:MAG: cysteine desulfurase [Anaerolineales bacterium]|nr:cysteine desulfurase [Anaerolineales bacterium]